MLRIVAVLLSLFLVVAAPAGAAYKNLTISQQPPGDQPIVRILTLNVMQSASIPRETRFQRIVNFLAQKQTAGQIVHVLLLQELSGGSVDGTTDSGADLARMLAAAGMPYGYFTKPAFGWPSFLVFKVGVMPRYRMLFTRATRLKAPLEYGVAFTGRKNVVMCGVNIPGFGRLNLYSVHVYSSPLEWVYNQVSQLLSFVNTVDQNNPPAVTVVGGDMNFGVTPDTIYIYDLFGAQGFVDAYAAVNGCGPAGCCQGGDFSGCTFAVPGNPLAEPGSFTARLDYLFVKGRTKAVVVVKSEVVFNGINGDWVSDHSGVLTEIALDAP